MITQLRFLSIGHGHLICVNKIYAIAGIRMAQDKRILTRAKKEGRFIDWSGHRKVASIIIMDDDKVIGSCFSVGTLNERIQKVCCFDVTRDRTFEEDTKNEQPMRQWPDWSSEDEEEEDEEIIEDDEEEDEE